MLTRNRCKRPHLLVRGHTPSVVITMCNHQYLCAAHLRDNRVCRGVPITANARAIVGA